MISRNLLYPVRSDQWQTLFAPLYRHFWLILLIVTVGALSSLAYSQMLAPRYEATAVVQARPGSDIAAVRQRLTSPANLMDMVLRHSIGPTQTETTARVAARLGQSIALRDLTTSAGGTLGYAPETSGIVISVLWPDAETSARMANDMALQVLDAGSAGALDAGQADLAFYRREEQRIWQEVAALKAELGRVSGDRNPGRAQRLWTETHRLTLMQDQHDLIRQRLAAAEVDGRRDAAIRSGQFRLLLRATSAEAVSVVQNWMLAGVAGSLLLAVALAFVLERRYPGLQRDPWADFGAANQRLLRVYRFFDDPDAPILGVPRFVVVAFVVVVWLVVIARAIA